MYIPKHFEETDPATLRELIRAHPLATIVTNGADGLNANHVPLLFTDSVLRGHIARVNPLAQESGDSLAVFQGPGAYISPSWYATKAETGRVVPTWNYAVVHAHGVLRVIENAEWLRQQLHDLTDQSEAGFAEPWAVSDAPKDYVEGLLKAIVGIEIAVTKLVGKWKVSQNQPERNRITVCEGLQILGNSGMAELVSERKRLETE